MVLQLPGKPVLPTKSISKIQPYKCSFCPNTYSTQYGVKRHAKQKHPDSVTPVVSQPTEHPIPAGHPYVKLIELDGYPAATEESPPLSDKQEDLPPLPPDNDVPPVNDVILTTSQSPKRGKKKPKKKSNIIPGSIVPKRVMETRGMRKRKFLIDSDNEQPGKYHRGGNFYYAWD